MAWWGASLHPELLLLDELVAEHEQVRGGSEALEVVCATDIFRAELAFIDLAN